MTRNAVTSGWLVPSCCRLTLRQATTAVLAGTYGTVLYSISNNSDTQTDLDAASRPKIMSKSLPWVLEEI